MEICSCDNPKIAAVEAGAAIPCLLCGQWWAPQHGSNMPTGRRVSPMPQTAGAPAGPLMRRPELPIVFDHGEVHTEGEPGPAMTQARAQSVAEEVCEFRAEKITCKSSSGRCFIEVKWNACNRITFTGRDWFLALRGLMRHMQEKKQLQSTIVPFVPLP